MIDVTLICNNRDFSLRLSTYKITKVVETVKSVVTLDGVEHIVQRTRDQIVFSLIPFSDSTATADYSALRSLQFSVTYTDPNAGVVKTGTMRVASNLDAAFGLKSIDGNRYYKGGNITLRALSPNA